MSVQANVKVIDCVSTLISLLDNIANLQTCPPSLFLDLEGTNLGRHGSISIISFFVDPKNTVYLVDVYRLGRAAFSTTNSRTISLKTILESSAIPKIVFDIRNDSDALFNEYQILVDGIQDLQLMELAARQGSKTFVAGLAKCIYRDSTVAAAEKSEWQHIKESVTNLFDPKKGGRYEIFDERPLRPEIVRYCARDVTLLPGLYKVYDTKLRPPSQEFWRDQVRKATPERIRLSQRPDYDGQAKSKVYGPWDESYIERKKEDWNEDVMFDATHDEEDDWSDPWGMEELTNPDDFYQDTARDCDGWEDDMIKNGSPF